METRKEKLLYSKVQKSKKELVESFSNLKLDNIFYGKENEKNTQFLKEFFSLEKSFFKSFDNYEKALNLFRKVLENFEEEEPIVFELEFQNIHFRVKTLFKHFTPFIEKQKDLVIFSKEYTKALSLLKTEYGCEVIILANFIPIKNHLLNEIIEDNTLLNTRIKLLDKPSSKLFWYSLFNTDKPRQYFEKNHPLNSANKQIIVENWRENYSKNDKTTLVKKLENHFNEQDTIYFFSCAIEVIECEFGTFKEYILEFLEYDDESYFYNQTNEKLYQIAPLGFIQEILWQK